MGEAGGRNKEQARGGQLTSGGDSHGVGRGWRSGGTISRLDTTIAAASTDLVIEFVLIFHVPWCSHGTQGGRGTLVIIRGKEKALKSMSNTVNDKYLGKQYVPQAGRVMAPKLVGGQLLI